MTPNHYEDAFSSRHDVILLGPLNLPSGTVVACDPFFAGIAVPVARTVPAGEYDVQLRRAESSGEGPRIALARIVFQPGTTPATYERAMKEGTDSNLYSVESGLGSFMDEVTRRQFVDVMAQYYHLEPDANYYSAKLAPEFKKSALHPGDPDDAGAWAMHYLPGSSLNVAMFASGLGDGAFESFWGLSDLGEIVSLTTDFRIL
jgi:hypothetical protein